MSSSTGEVTQERLKAVSATRDGFELDQLDESSHYIAVIYDGELVGGCRMIAGEGNDLPVRSCTFLPILGKQVEISRF